MLSPTLSKEKAAAPVLVRLELELKGRQRLQSSIFTKTGGKHLQRLLAFLEDAAFIWRGGGLDSSFRRSPGGAQ